MMNIKTMNDKEFDEFIKTLYDMNSSLNDAKASWTKHINNAMDFHIKDFNLTKEQEETYLRISQSIGINLGTLFKTVLNDIGNLEKII